MGTGILGPLVLATAVTAGPPGPEPVPGQVVDRIPCRSDPSKTYALFLPAGYRPEKTWPILYVFDARRRGRLGADLFREVAGRRGWIVASSNNTESDASMGPSLEAIRDLWDDTHARLSVDGRRVYAAGFSGGARLASGLASVRPGAVTGVICCSGGFPTSMKPSKETSFALFGTAGSKDFNYQEMRALDSTLGTLGVPHRLRVFEGAHAWPPPQVCSRAVEWMDLRAIKSGLLAPDPPLVESFLGEGLATAQKAEEGGNLAEALGEYADLAEDLRGLRDVADLERNAVRLKTSTSAAKDLKAHLKSDADEAAYLVRMGHALAALRDPAQPVLLRRIVEELEIPDLKRKVARGGDSYDGASAARRLESAFTSTAFYIFREFLESKNYARAALSLLIAKEIKPDDANVWYNLACMDARKGDRKDALGALGKSVAAGFKDARQLETDDDLAALRSEPGFRELLAKLQSAAQAGGAPVSQP